jgi:hypothetical protein
MGSEILHRMAYEDLAPEDFVRDPGAAGDLLGDELLGLVRQLADRAASILSALKPPDLHEDTRKTRRRRDQFSYTVNDPQFEDEKRVLLQQIIEWGIADPAHLDAFKADPSAVIRRLGADRHPAVQQALIDLYPAK